MTGVVVDNPTVSAWSKSGLSSLLDGCSWRWLLTKTGLVDDPGSPATVLGTAYHAAIERHQRIRIAARRSGTTPVLNRVEISEHASDVLVDEAAKLPAAQWEVHGTSLEELEERLLVAIGNWWDHGLRDLTMRWVPVESEMYVRVAIDDDGDVIVHGYPDETYWDPDAAQWVVVDDKSTEKLGQWPQDGAGHEHEGALYVAATSASKLSPLVKPRAEWHVARTITSERANFIPTRRIVRPDLADDAWRDAVIDRARAAARIVGARAYEKNPQWFLCSKKWCPAFDPCMEKQTLVPGAVTIR